MNALNESQKKILSYLRDSSIEGEQLSNKAIAEGTKISEVMVGRYLAHLEEEGMVVSDKRTSGDRRCKLVRLTREGMMVSKWLMDL